MKHVPRLISFLLLLFALVGNAAAEEYAIDVSTTPEKITARDNPFAHYDDLGDLPSVTVSVKDSAGQLAADVTISMTITHVDNLILPSGFPWVQGKELLSVTSLESDGTLTVDGLLFPLRGDYTVDVKVTDASGNQQTEQFTVHASEPFQQSTLNGLIFLTALLLFGAITGYIFGKDIFVSKKAQGRYFGVFSIIIVCLFVAVPFVLSHSEEEFEETGEIHYEDEQMIFYTAPEVPDIGKETRFTFTAFDENGNPVNNAVATVELANEEEGFVVLETELFSQTGTFTFEYGIFDGAPHIATIRVEPTAASSVAFAPIEKAYAFAGTAHNPPFSAKLIATVVMLAAMLVGFALGVACRKLFSKQEHLEGDSHE